MMGARPARISTWLCTSRDLQERSILRSLVQILMDMRSLLIEFLARLPMVTPLVEGVKDRVWIALSSHVAVLMLSVQALFLHEKCTTVVGQFFLWNENGREAWDFFKSFT